MRPNPIIEPKRSWFAPGDVVYLELLEANWRNLAEKADLAYELGMLDEAEVLDEAAEQAAQWLDWAASEVEEGGDLDIYGREEGIPTGPEDELGNLWRRWLKWTVEQNPYEGIDSREELVRIARNVLTMHPGMRQDVSDDIIVEAARDAYEAREEFKRRYRQKKRASESFTKNPPSWATDAEAWERAEAAVWPRWEDYDEPYAVVAFVYKRIVAAKERKARSARASKASKARWAKARRKARG